MAYIEIEKTPNDQLYPRIKGSQTLTSEQITERLTQDTTLTPSDIKAVLSGLSTMIVEHLRQGNRVRLDELGEFYLTLAISEPSKEQKEEEIRTSDLKFKQLHFRADRKLVRKFSDLTIPRKKGYSKGKNRQTLAQRRTILLSLLATHHCVTIPLYCRQTGTSTYQARKDMVQYLSEELVRLERMNTAHYYYPSTKTNPS